MPNQSKENYHPFFIGSAACMLGAVGIMFRRYKVSAPNQYLVRTGLGIQNIKITKQGFQWPFQTFRFIDVTPQHYPFQLSAMTEEKLQFRLPGVMTIGPKLTDDDSKSLYKYAQLIADSGVTEQSKLIHGIIEGETRILAANMKMNSLFQNRAEFKEQITKGVGQELEPFGLTVYNANIQELEDSEGSEYFKYLREKAKEGAINITRVDVADSRMKGDIGSKERETTQRQAQAKLETAARETEYINEQQIEKAKMELEQNKISYTRQNDLTRVEAKQAVAMRDAELQTQVEDVRYQQQLKRGRAETVVTAEVEAQKAIHQAEGQAESQRRLANAELYSAEKKAQATVALWNAEAEGLNRVMGALGGNPSAFLWYRMMDKGILEKLASENAKAVQNLNPKITVWNTGGDGKQNNPFDSLQRLFQFLPPVLTTISEQTGMNIPMVPKENVVQLSKHEEVIQSPKSNPARAEDVAAIRAKIYGTYNNSSNDLL